MYMYLVSVYVCMCERVCVGVVCVAYLLLQYSLSPLDAKHWDRSKAYGREATDGCVMEVRAVACAQHRRPHFVNIMQGLPAVCLPAALAT
jgi:hypothetical protein